MTPEASRFLDKAQKLLEHATTMLTVSLNDDAGRTAYLAGFHAAQAYIFEKTGKILKTHNGVHAEFSRLTKGESHFSPGQRIFLSQAYNLKAIADYDTSPDIEVSADRARQAVTTAEQFVLQIAALVRASPEDTLK